MYFNQAFKLLAFVGVSSNLLFLESVHGIGVAGPDIATCPRQAACMELQVTKTDPNICSNAECEFEVCLQIYQKEGSECPVRFSRSCKKPSDMCSSDYESVWNQSGFPATLDDGTSFATQQQFKKIDPPYIECQVVGPTQLVEFMVQDHKGCHDSVEATLTPISDIGAPASCAPRTEDTESCSSTSAVGRECVWTYYSPHCDGTPYSPGPVAAA